LRNLEKLIAHNHWICCNVAGKEVHICARCLGTVLGFTFSKFFLYTSSLGKYVTSVAVGLPLSLMLIMPTVIDWMTQKMGFRQSRNKLRLVTGFLEGTGIIIFNLLNISLNLKYVIFTSFGVGVASVGILGKKLIQRNVSRSQSLTSHV